MEGTNNPFGNVFGFQQPQQQQQQQQQQQPQSSSAPFSFSMTPSNVDGMATSSSGIGETTTGFPVFGSSAKVDTQKSPFGFSMDQQPSTSFSFSNPSSAQQQQTSTSTAPSFSFASPPITSIPQPFGTPSLSSTPSSSFPSLSTPSVFNPNTTGSSSTFSFGVEPLQQSFPSTSFGTTSSGFGETKNAFTGFGTTPAPTSFDATVSNPLKTQTFSVQRELNSFDLGKPIYYQSITKQKDYEDYSFEELRWEYMRVRTPQLSSTPSVSSFVTKKSEPFFPSVGIQQPQGDVSTSSFGSSFGTSFGTPSAFTSTSSSLATPSDSQKFGNIFGMPSTTPSSSFQLSSAPISSSSFDIGMNQTFPSQQQQNAPSSSNLFGTPSFDFGFQQKQKETQKPSFDIGFQQQYQPNFGGFQVGTETPRQQFPSFGFGEATPPVQITSDYPWLSNKKTEDKPIQQQGFPLSSFDSWNKTTPSFPSFSLQQQPIPQQQQQPGISDAQKKEFIPSILESDISQVLHYPYGTDIYRLVEQQKRSGYDYEKRDWSEVESEGGNRKKKYLYVHPIRRVHPLQKVHTDEPIRQRLFLFDEHSDESSRNDDWMIPHEEIKKLKISPELPEDDSEKGEGLENEDGEKYDENEEIARKQSEKSDNQGSYDLEVSKKRVPPPGPPSSAIKKPIATHIETMEHLEQKPPTLKRQGYYTKPPMRELVTMTGNERMKVKDFIIGRKGYGEIQFTGETNVNNLELDKMIDIEQKYVNVYPERYYSEKEKPQRGEELNKRATITLFHVFPRNKNQTGWEKQFIGRLKKTVNEKMRDSSYISYDPATGRWVFEVQHFS